MKARIETSDAPQTNALYSQAIVSGNMIFVAGQIHIALDGKLVGNTLEEKVAQIMKNITAILKAVDTTLEDVVKVTVYVTDIIELPKFNEIYKTYFKEPMPAREAVAVKALPLGASIEMSVIASKKGGE